MICVGVRASAPSCGYPVDRLPQDGITQRMNLSFELLELLSSVDGPAKSPVITVACALDGAKLEG